MYGQPGFTQVNPSIDLHVRLLPVALADGNNQCVLPARRAPCQKNTIAVQERFPLSVLTVLISESRDSMVEGKKIA